MSGSELLARLPGLLDGAASAAFGAALRWTPLLLVVLVAARLWRGTAAAFRHALWAAALIALLGMVPAVKLLPAWQPWSGGVAWSAARDQVLARLPSGVRERIAGTPSEGLATAKGEGVAGFAPRANGSPQPWAWLWLAGAAALALREVARAARGRTLLRGADVVRDAAATPTLPQRRGLLVLAAPVRIPGVAGVWRPRMLLPRGWNDWPRAWRDASLRHELAHVERGDLRWLLLARWTRALFWFHPGIWLAVRRLAAEAEKACDERAVVGGLDRLAYAEALVGIAGAVRGNRGAEPALAVTGAAASLRARVSSLLSRDPATRRRPRLVWLAPLGVLTVVMASGQVSAPAGASLPATGLPLVRAGASGWMLRCAPGDVACASATQHAVRLLLAAPAGGTALVARVDDGRVDGYASIGGHGEAGPAVPLVPPGSIAKVALAAAWWESGLDDVTLGCPPVAHTTGGLTVRSTTAAPATLRAPHEVLVFSCNSAALSLARVLEARRGRAALSAAMAPLLPDGRMAPYGDPDRDAAAFISPSFDWEAQSAGIGPLRTTPLEVAHLVQAVGNGGMATVPWAAAAAGAREEPQRLFSPSTAKRLADALDDAVRRGTAQEAERALGGSPWRLGGKTGSVRNDDGTVDGWFAGLASDAGGQPERVVGVWLRAAGPGGIEPARLAARLTRAVGAP